MHFVLLLKSFARLTEADWIAFALSVVFPIGLAVAGGILAAIALPKDEINAKRKKWLWHSGFALAGLTSLLLGLGQQKMAVDQRESDQKEAKTKLTDSETRELATQNKLDFLTNYIQKRPLGLTEADRGWILLFLHASVPTNKPSEPASAPSLLTLHDAALGLSKQIQSKITAEATAYKADEQKRNDDRRKEMIAHGMTEQQATLAVAPVGYGGSIAMQAPLEYATTKALTEYQPQIRELLSSVDASNLSKVRGYDHIAQTASAEESVQTSCISILLPRRSCVAALENLSATLN